jgi:DNA-binding transcriptional LysR family regulator
MCRPAARNRHNRSSRRFAVTEIGREFNGRCVAMLVMAEAAEHVAAQRGAASDYHDPGRHPRA